MKALCRLAGTVLLAVSTVGLGAQSAPPAPEASALKTPAELRGEALALRLLKRPDIRAAVARVAALYAADPQGRTAAGRTTIPRASAAIGMAAIYYAIGEDSVGPSFLWCCNAPHRWAGLDMPRAGYGIDNPDDVYRITTLDGRARYEIRGRVPAPGPAEEHFELRDSIPGTSKVLLEGGKLLAGLRSDQMSIAADGSFTITLDATPSNGRPNHIELPPEDGLHLIVRDLFTDWSVQNPVHLAIERLDPPARARPRSENEIAARAVAILDKIAPFWLGYFNKLTYAQPANTLPTPIIRGVGRGMVTAGYFRLASDEALVITLDSLGAKSLGIQLTDPWGVAYDYVDRTSSLSNAQAQPNADGSYTYVISVRDPGAYNWLDPEGFGGGMVAPRWQSLPAGADPAKAIREVRVVKLDALRKTLPPQTAFVSPAERQKQRQARTADYSRRLVR